DGNGAESLGEAFADERVGLAIGLGDGIGGPLVVDGEVALVHALDDAGCLARDAQHHRQLFVAGHVTTPARDRSLASCGSASVVRYGGSVPASRTSCSSCETSFGPSTALETISFESTNRSAAARKVSTLPVTRGRTASSCRKRVSNSGRVQRELR